MKTIRAKDLIPSQIRSVLSPGVFYNPLFLLLSFLPAARLSVFISEDQRRPLCSAQKVTLRQIWRPRGHTRAISLPISAFVAERMSGQGRG